LNRAVEALLDRTLHDGIDTGIFTADTPAKIVIKQSAGMSNWTSRWFQPDGEFSYVGDANPMADTILNGYQPTVEARNADSV
jgi:hypothetical protein